MSSIEMITVRFQWGEQITMTETDVQYFSRDGLCIGHASTAEFLDFLKEKLADIKHDASIEHGEDAAA
jgi:hypothetical protein